MSSAVHREAETRETVQDWPRQCAYCAYVPAGFGQESLLDTNGEEEYRAFVEAQLAEVEAPMGTWPLGIVLPNLVLVLA